jgi:hypothetical protein
MGPIFNGYGVMGIFNSRTRPHVNRAYETSCRLVAYFLHCKHYFCQLSYRQSSFRISTLGE